MTVYKPLKNLASLAARVAVDVAKGNKPATTDLLDNGAKAAVQSDPRALEVDARRSDGDVSIRVVDHGTGVPEAAREQLFYPFYQVSQRHPRLGTGLGLAIAKGFLSSMDGRIWIEDTPGGGATFAFSLPAVAAVPAR